GHPVLAIGAMKIAAQHAERQRVPTRKRMPERFLLDRIDLKPRHIARRNPKLPTPIEADPAYAGLPVADQAPVPTSNATQRAVALINRQFRRAGHRVLFKNLLQ